ncbi:type II toxin-antitoxin system YafQ family toxin [Bacteroides sp. GD17]|jgi:mRNA interferase YafQ|uniref:type II toxin-antitoxin system RelE/ParE family toxin n=1 Tax=Bacteroides sp. GD17 TaxID=3139826 RepID=UPI0025E6E4CD|nr:type II toxin-antitoxin system YafQ family toxin [uncultured Bacteroides sp.]
MKEVKTTKQFRKDLKRIQNNPKKIANLKKVILLLSQTGTLPKEYNLHSLIGNYKGCLECHVENDLLLIWIDEEEKVIKLLRLGSHSELF